GGRSGLSRRPCLSRAPAPPRWPRSLHDALPISEFLRGTEVVMMVGKSLYLGDADINLHTAEVALGQLEGDLGGVQVDVRVAQVERLPDHHHDLGPAQELGDRKSVV